MPKDTLYPALPLSPPKPHQPNECICSMHCMNDAQGWLMFASDAEVGGVQIPPYFLCKDVEFLLLQAERG